MYMLVIMIIAAAIGSWITYALIPRSSNFTQNQFNRLKSLQTSHGEKLKTIQDANKDNWGNISELIHLTHLFENSK